MSQALAGRCPQCSAIATLDASNRFRPFCSERCKLLDFGAWANGQYSIPAVENDDDADDGGSDEARPPLQ